MNVAVVVAVAALAVLAAVVLVAVSRRADTKMATRLSRETRGRDRSAVPYLSEHGRAALRGKAYERSVALERIESGRIERVPSVPPVHVPPDPQTLGVTRRQFVNRSIVAFTTFSLSGFAAAVVGFLWPNATGGFGSKINVGAVEDVKAQIRANNGFLYVPEGRMWVTEYPADKIDKAAQVYAEPVLTGMRAGLVALWQTCPHLGCRVPQCESSQWFECPCHGSKYNRVGEKRGGPAPRGMDRFGVVVDADGSFVVDTGALFQGPPIGTNTTGQEAEGPNCVGQAAAHSA